MENLFVLHYDNACSHGANSTQKFLQKNNMWLMPHPPFSPDFVPCDFFFHKIEIATEGTASRGFERNNTENSRLPAEHSQI